MNKTVFDIGKMNFEGNVIPMAWFSRLCFESGKPNTVAIICLSEIVYWYRPVEIRDEATGKVKGYRQKFKADKWQCNYQAMADRFGFSKEQVRNALHFLEEAGCITLEFRHFRADSGTPLSNVLFVEPVPLKIAEINALDATTSTHIDIETDMGGDVDIETQTISVQEPTHIGTGTDTYTETPTEIPEEDDDFSFSLPPLTGVPRATDNHQRRVDLAAGGSETPPGDPVEDVARHHYQGFMGGPAPQPARRDWAKWKQAGECILRGLDGLSLHDILYGIDAWWLDGDRDKFWKDKPCKPETLDLVIRYCAGAARHGGDIPAGIVVEPVDEAEALWSRCLALLKSQGRAGRLEGSRGVLRANGTLRVACSAEQKEWIEQRLPAVMAGVVDQVAPGLEIIYEVAS